ncbi:MAG: hypothetical protein EOP39_08070 [Rubrivivax sp.]|nr:MAG: hypothetical protein EOP39_08070 [Rubrivivax sp.]
MKSPALLTLMLCALPGWAQDGRDPTTLPGALRSAIAAAEAASAPASGVEPSDNAIRQIVFTNGRGYVVQRGRRYAVGELLDGAHIERITEQAVWLREAGQVRREPLYGGVEKRQPETPKPSDPAARKSKEKQP